MPRNDTLANDAPANATTTFQVGVGEIVAGTITSGADQDWFSITLKAGVEYTFAVVGIGTDLLVSPEIALFDARSAPVATVNPATDNNNALMTVTPTANGVYYVKAAGADAGTYKLSVAAGSKATYDPEMAAGAIDSTWHWTVDPGTGGTVTFGFRDSVISGGDNADTFRPFSNAQQAAARAMIAETMDIAGIVFTDVAPDRWTNDAQILFVNYGNGEGGGFAYYPQVGSTAASKAGDIWVAHDPSKAEVSTGTWDWQTLQHELGHAIGLTHTGDYNGGGVTFDADAEFIQDNIGLSIMSYFNRGPAADSGLIPDGWMLADVIALQNIYGANMTTRTGNTTYGFNSNAGGIFDFAINEDPLLTIWDAGGIDVLDVSEFAGNQRIDLHGMAYSSVLGFAQNVAIAPGAKIENAKAGAGSDVLQGNDLANRLSGNAGDDTLRGGMGADMLNGGMGNDRLTGGMGADRLVGRGGQDTMDAGADNRRDVFVFLSVNDSAANRQRDMLVNFDSAQDMINLRALDANLDRDGNQEFAGFGFQPRDHGVWAVQRDGATTLFADVTGDGRADFSIRLVATTGFTADSVLL